MDPLEQLRAHVADFPGYDTDLHRRRSDEFARSYVGEALAELEARFNDLSPELQQRIDALLLRVGFASPKSFGVHNGSGMQIDASLEGDVAADDLAAIELADRATSISLDSLPAYLDDVAAALDRRDAAMRAAATKT
jgi:hypothetical protein